MWDDIVRQLDRFETGVLSIVGDDGYPLSFRCDPTPDHTRQTLRVEFPDWITPTKGRAGLLCHYHDERLWNQRSFVVRGRLECDAENRWHLAPERFVPGMGHHGLSGMLRMVWHSRRRAIAYFRKRGLPVPETPWKELAAVKKQVFG